MGYYNTPCWHIRVDLCLEKKYEIIWRTNSIRFLCRLTCAFLIPLLKSSGSELGCYMGFELGCTVGMVLGTPVGYPLEYSIGMLIGLAFVNYFGKLGGYLVGVTLGIISGLMIGTGGGYFVGLSLVLPLIYSLESSNTESMLPCTIMGTPLGLWFVSKLIKYGCSWHRLTDFCKSTCGEVDISCVPHYGAVITSNKNSVRYCQLLEFLTLVLSPTCLIPSYGGMLGAG